MEKEKTFEDWKVDQKIAQMLRPILLIPSIDAVYMQISEPWPTNFNGDGIDNQIQSVSIAPFPLASIENSEHLEIITTKAVKALSENDPDLLRNDEKYLTCFWGLKKESTT